MSRKYPATLTAELRATRKELAKSQKALAATLAVLDYLLTQTVDADLAYGVGLSEGEADARKKALKVFAKYGPEYPATDRQVEGVPVPN